VRGREVTRLLRRRLGWNLTPVEVLRMMRADAHPVALFGSWADGCDVIASEPVLTRSGAAGALDGVLDSSASVLRALDDAGSAFGGGWIGYLGYSAAGEALPGSGHRRLPPWWFGYYDHVLRREQATGEWFFEALWTAERADALERRFADLSARAAAPPRPPGDQPGYRCGPFRLIPSAAGHQAAVRQTVDYIRQGDIFQANICLRTEADFDGDPLDAFCQAATALSPPYAAFVSVPGGAAASLSPELFLRRTDATVVSRPIKGTAHRSPEADAATRQRGDLERSPKNRAENVMIVDLVRNDLSRVCVPGSVTVPSLLGAEPHPGVWHLVSEVRGTLRESSCDGDLIRAAFPPGSVTGAPKVRALEVIDELEAVPREIYTGAIGYLSPVAGLELNVAIRTFEFASGRVWLGVGGGIVADSDPGDEYAECLIKAGPLISAIGGRLDTESAGAPGQGPDLLPRPATGVFTSLKVSAGQTRNLEGHLARLAASTAKLYGKDLPASLRADLCDCLAEEPSGRLRITVRPVGGPLQAFIEVVPLAPGPDGPVSLRPTVISGGLGAHKWRDRRLLAELTRRSLLGPDEQLLITDETGELLETDRGNLFAVADGVLLTPPADGRLLPGTTRAEIVRAARSRDIRVGFKPLTLDQLTAASEVFVCNAVYGVLPVRSIDGCPATWEPGPLARRFAAALAARSPDTSPASPSPSASPSPASPASPSPSASPAPSGRIGVVAHNDESIGAVGHSTKIGSARPFIILVDNYDSFTYNLAHLLEGAGCRVEVVRNDEVPADRVSRSGASGVVISPGPCAPADAGISIDVVRACAGRVPLLGICLGHQAIAAAFGAAIIKAPRPVHGQACQISHDGAGVLTGLPHPFEATRYHSLIVDEDTLPAELVMGLRHVTYQVEGVQFHPESILTTHGPAIIRNFVQSAGGRS
jgi:para-aminobenzoate synthetase/4-amino-4-deoxychorismate lyase